MDPAFTALASTAPATLPDGLVLAMLASRPTRVAGPQPAAAVVLLDIEVKGLAT
ncbi:MAG: hypothetical protein J0H91_00655 [Rhodospirillales bacterium]|nr:hypothetical protein [Rhodospirillales bacterium]